MSALPVTIIFCLGLLILFLERMPSQQRGISLLALGNLGRKRGRGLSDALRSAGLHYESPSLFVLAVLCGAVITAVIAYLLTGRVWLMVISPPLFVIGTQVWIHRRQRRWLNQATEELVPFLNRISTSVKAGMPTQQAYMQAVSESQALHEILGESASKIAAGASFIPSLLETLEVLPLRMWSSFVRQMELYEQTGGDMAEGLDRTVTQLSEMLMLQAEARADYTVQAVQQKAILIILGVALFVFLFVMEGGSDRLHLMVGTVPGLIGTIIGVAVICGGYWGLGKQIRDIERKVSF